MGSGVQKNAKGKVEVAALQGVPIWWENSVLQAGRLAPGASIEDWLKASGMTFTFRKAKLMYYADRKQTDLREDPDNVAIIRSDTGERMGIAHADYNITQPYQMLEFFRDLVAGSGFQLTTAGVLFGGKRMWVMARITEAKINGWDRVGAYLLISTSADGSMSNEGRLTTICVVCDNTLRMAFGQANAKARVSHRVTMAMDRLKGELGLDVASRKFAEFVANANALAKAKVTHAAADDFVLRLLRGAAADPEVQQSVIATAGDDLKSLLAAPYTPKDPEQDLETLLRRPRGADAILELFDGAGRGADKRGRSGTAWGLVNAVTEYVDHIRPSKTDDHRILNAWWGDGDTLKAQAATMALQEFAA